MADTQARCTAEVFQGLPCHRLQLPGGDQLLVAEQGAHVLSWLAGGCERLFLSSRNVWNGHTAIRGGVPVCFPQFNLRGQLPKHGIARNARWQRGEVVSSGDGVTLVMHWRDDAQTRAIWPQQFEAELRVTLSLGQLTVALKVDNTDTQALQFSGALHTYFAVDGIAQAALHGLQGQAEWDAVADVHGQAAEVLRFDGAFDRVYAATAEPLTLRDGNHSLRIEQSSNWGQHVVWNPGASACATMSDMPADGYAHMLCVEAAQVYEPITVPPGQSWLGWQRLTTL